METEQIKSFNVIGIFIRTSNENGQAAIDIPALWNKFMTEGIMEKIPNKVDNTLYCIYTDYEKDHTKPYNTVLGCKVANLDLIPQGMVVKTIMAGNYNKFTAKGNIMHGIIFNAWTEIWNTNISRKYTTDFEVYGEKAQNPEDAEVDIFIAV